MKIGKWFDNKMEENPVKVGVLVWIPCAVLVILVFLLGLPGCATPEYEKFLLLEEMANKRLCANYETHHQCYKVIKMRPVMKYGRK